MKEKTNNGRKRSKRTGFVCQEDQREWPKQAGAFRNYEMIYPIHYNGEYNGARFECKDCMDFVWAKKKPYDKEYEQISFSEFMKPFGEQM